jgi:ATPase subunit of ABC transporter with duplicated ATPase domains
MGGKGQGPAISPRTTPTISSGEALTDWIKQWVRAGGYEGGDVETLMRGTLGRLLFSGDEVKKPVRVISGGEQGRMLFGKLMLLRPTCC